MQRPSAVQSNASRGGGAAAGGGAGGPAKTAGGGGGIPHHQGGGRLAQDQGNAAGAAQSSGTRFNKFSEQAIVNAIVNQVGHDEDAALMRRTPAQRSTLVEYSVQQSTTDYAKEVSGKNRKLAAIGESKDGATDASEILKQALTGSVDDSSELETQVLEGGPVLSQLILSHLTQEGLTEAAEVFKQELQSYGYNKTYFLRDNSPVVLPRLEPPTPTPMGQLLCPANDTRERVSILLSEPERKIVECDASGNRRDDITMKFLVEMVQAPMWSPSDHGRSLVSQDSGRLRAGTLNELVERATDVRIAPNKSTYPKIKEEADTEFIMALCRTHRHFTSSHALLAKLLQRFFVPHFLPLTDVFEDYGVTVLNNTGKPIKCGLEGVSSSTALWIAVCKQVQIKVATVVATWLQTEPDHFDSAMLEAVTAWVEDCLYSPTLWSESPIELFQCAEVIKSALASRTRSLTKNKAGTGLSHFEALNPMIGEGSTGDADALDVAMAGILEGGGNSGGGFDDGGAKDAISILFTRHRSQVSGGFDGGATHSSFSTRVPNPQSGALNVLAAGGAGSSGGNSFAGLNFLQVDDLRLANQLTAIDHSLFRKIHYKEFYVFATNNGARSLHSTNHPAMHLNTFLRRGEELTQWVVTELVRPRGAEAGAQENNDEYQQQGGGNPRLDESNPNCRPFIFEKFVSLMYRLLDMNNIHSAFAVLCGLRHPVVTRLRALTLAVNPSARDSLLAVEEQFNFHEGYRGYKTYLKGIPDGDVYCVIPLVSVSIDEVRRLMCAEPTVLRDTKNKGLVHWRKYSVLGHIYGQLLHRQKQPVPAEFGIVPNCVQWLNERFATAVHDPERLLEYSLLVEPRQGTLGPVVGKH